MPHDSLLLGGGFMLLAVLIALCEIWGQGHIIMDTTTAIQAALAANASALSDGKAEVDQLFQAIEAEHAQSDASLAAIENGFADGDTSSATLEAQTADLRASNTRLLEAIKAVRSIVTQTVTLTTAAVPVVPTVPTPPVSVFNPGAGNLNARVGSTAPASPSTAAVSTTSETPVSSDAPKSAPTPNA